MREFDLAVKIQQELIDIWIEHCTEHTVRNYRRDVRKLIKRYKKHGIKIHASRNLYKKLWCWVEINGKKFSLDLWPGWGPENNSGVYPMQEEVPEDA